MHAHAHHGASPSFRYLHGLSKVGSLARSALCTLLTSALVPPATGAKATEYQRAAVQFLNESVLPHPGQSLPEVLLAQDDAAEYSESFEETSNEGTPKPAPVTARNPAPPAMAPATALVAGPLGGAGAGAAAGAAAATGPPVCRTGARAGKGLGSPPGNASREATAIRGAAGHGRHRMGAAQPPETQPQPRTLPSAGRHASGDDPLEASYGGSDVTSELDLDLSADSPYRPSPGSSPRRLATAGASSAPPPALTTARPAPAATSTAATNAAAASSAAAARTPPKTTLHKGVPIKEVAAAQDDAAEYSESFDETSNEGTPKPAPVTARADLPTSSVAARHDARATGGSGIAGSGGGGGRASCRAPPAATTRPAVRPVAARAHMLSPSEDPPSDELESLSLDVEDILPH